MKWPAQWRNKGVPLAFSQDTHFNVEKKWLKEGHHSMNFIILGTYRKSVLLKFLGSHMNIFQYKNDENMKILKIYKEMYW